MLKGENEAVGLQASNNQVSWHSIVYMSQPYGRYPSWECTRAGHILRRLHCGSKADCPAVFTINVFSTRSTLSILNYQLLSKAVHRKSTTTTFLINEEIVESSFRSESLQRSKIHERGAGQASSTQPKFVLSVNIPVSLSSLLNPSWPSAEMAE